MKSIEEAIKTAIEYEEKIRDLYKEAADKIDDPSGQKTLRLLRDDEQGHVDYLYDRLRAWKETGSLSLVKLETLVPPVDRIKAGVKRIETRLTRKQSGTEKEILTRALNAEIETSRFYQKMVDEMPGEAKPLFEEFLKIEENHIDYVQLELDCVSQNGYWFDFEEFDMEAY